MGQWIKPLAVSVSERDSSRNKKTPTVNPRKLMVHLIQWTKYHYTTTFSIFYLCLTEGYKKGYISLHHFENCDFSAVFLESGSSSVVEHRLAKARVASSNLVSRSTKSRMKADG